MAREKQHDAFLIQATDIPSDGRDISGSASFEELDIEADDYTAFPQPLVYTLHIQQVGEDLLVTGRLQTTIRQLCDRCAEFSDVLLETEDVCHRYENAIGQVIDLTEGIREDILLVFPQSHLCSEDCKGLCPRCGANLNDGPCGCPEDFEEDEGGSEAEASESPWSALDSLSF